MKIATDSTVQRIASSRGIPGVQVLLIRAELHFFRFALREPPRL